MTQEAHTLDYSDPSTIDGRNRCQGEICRFVRGIRGSRGNPVNLAQITAWFKATPAAFVSDQLDAALAAGTVEIRARSMRSHREHNGAYVYVVGPNAPELPKPAEPTRVLGKAPLLRADDISDNPLPAIKRGRCNMCGTNLSGRQRKLCSAECRKAWNAVTRNMGHKIAEAALFIQVNRSGDGRKSEGYSTAMAMLRDIPRDTWSKITGQRKAP